MLEGKKPRILTEFWIPNRYASCVCIFLYIHPWIDLASAFLLLPPAHTVQTERIHLRFSQMLHSNPSVPTGRENPLQLRGRKRLSYFMDECNNRRLDSGGTCFVPRLKLFRSSCSLLTQPSALSMSEWFSPKHWDQHLPHEVCLLIHPPPGRNLCTQCHVLLGRNWIGVFYRCRGLVLGNLTWHLKWSRAFMMVCIFRGAMKNPHHLLSRAVRLKHLHQMNKDLLLDPFKAFLHPSLINSLQKLRTHFRRTSWQSNADVYAKHLNESGELDATFFPQQRWAEGVQFRSCI